jgi:hypothetical protein
MILLLSYWCIFLNNTFPYIVENDIQIIAWKEKKIMRIKKVMV